MELTGRGNVPCPLQEPLRRRECAQQRREALDVFGRGKQGRTRGGQRPDAAIERVVQRGDQGQERVRSGEAAGPPFQHFKLEGQEMRRTEGTHNAGPLSSL